MGNRASAARPGVPTSAIVSAIALHAACVAAAVAFAHGVAQTPVPPQVSFELATLPSTERPSDVAPATSAAVAHFPAVQASAPDEIAALAPTSPMASLQPSQTIYDQASGDTTPLAEMAPTPAASVVDALPPIDASTVSPTPSPAAPVRIAFPPLRPSRPRAPTPSNTSALRGTVVSHEGSSATPTRVVAATQPAPMSTGAAPTAEIEAALETRIRNAVQAAVRYPASARMMGVTGRARVLLDYRGGAVESPSLAQSSGTPTLDAAALAAVRAARYPTPPPEIEGRLLRFLVWVDFSIS